MQQFYNLPTCGCALFFRYYKFFNHDVHIIASSVDLQLRFENLVYELTEVLTEKHIEYKNIINHFLNTPPENIGEHFTVLFKNMAEKPPNTQIDQFMNHLKKYMQFLDYKLLKEMASFASDKSDDLLKKVKKYEMDVIFFCQTVSISSFAKSGYCMCEHGEVVPSNFTPMQVRCEMDPDESTLEDLGKLQQRLSKQLGSDFMPAYIRNAMILFKVELLRDSQYITWLIPDEIAPHLMAAKAEPSNVKFFEELKIEVSFDAHKSDTSGSTSK